MGLLLGTLSCVVNIKCQPFPTSKINSYFSTDIKSNAKDEFGITAGDRGTIYAVHSEAARRSKRAGSFGSGCNVAGETCVRIILGVMRNACCSEMCLCRGDFCSCG